MKIVEMQEIKRSLERMRCSNCNEQPSITIIGGELKVTCCCAAFKKKIDDAAKIALTKQAKENIEKQLKSIFK